MSACIGVDIDTESCVMHMYAGREITSYTFVGRMSKIERRFADKDETRLGEALQREFEIDRANRGEMTTDG